MKVINLPAHEQDAFAETLDAAVNAQDDSAFTEQDRVLRDYLVREAKQIMESAPIVAERIQVGIAWVANDGGNVWVAGTPGPPPGFVLTISAA
jgi:hypothetical protein